MDKKRNNYISYLKGLAILGVMLVHLLDWSNIPLSNMQGWLKELLYPSVFLFIALVGSVVYVAYFNKPLMLVSKKLLRRGAELIGIYFLYSVIKLGVFNFKTEPFFWQFSEKNIFDIKHIFLFQAFSVPITIIFTIGLLLLVSPLILWLIKTIKYPVLGVLAIFIGSLIINYFYYPAQQPILQLLYGEHTVLVPPLFWIQPYLLGIIFAQLGFERRRGELFSISLLLTIGYVYYYAVTNQSLRLEEYMYPLKPFYLVASSSILFLLVYLFVWLESIKSSIIKYCLAVLRLLGNATLSIYIYHWVVIDLTIWLCFPSIKLIWLMVPLWLGCYVFLKRGKIKI
ncbi:MAG: acyltransferase family protein [Patescibacteria group bacterium]|jgi:hypothetical protein